ncbi:DUF3313 family protein [Halioglobus maricola]|uniref:DUF3313 family protein n=1 Tax=Halioglobus maricola TaxID=2601894 RepID=A0A5P9NNA1_9GAMM|nr:DUF3313 family protein [Halioglobus maricola]QFU77300.1 DUF3313 family protein [Halioglobus maricola]
MIRKISALFILSLVAAVSLSAQAEKPKTKDFSGWLESYETLVYVEERNAFFFSNENKRGHYEKVMLHEVTLYGKNARSDNELGVQSSDYLREGILAIFEDEGVLATEPGPKVARLSLAITGVEKSIESLKAHNLVPVSAVFRGAKRATGNLNTYIDVMFEGEATDSVTGERILAIVAKGIGSTEKKSGDELEFDDLVPTLDLWLVQYRKTVSDFLANKD